jgi:hypothetical protein
MSRSTVYELLERIEQLPAEDRRLLDDLLATKIQHGEHGGTTLPPFHPLGCAQGASRTQHEELEWREEAAKARQQARKRGLEQAAIDCAVHVLRHGE